MIENILLLLLLMAIGGVVFVAVMLGFAYYLETMDD
jgi:hypothetical protein